MTIIARPDDVRRQNQFGILTALRRRGNLSRTGISTTTGLSASTVTVISSSLMERGVLTAEQVGEQANEQGGQKRGRPQVRLLPNPRFASIAVMRLALNLISADIYDYSGKALGSKISNVRTKAMTAGELTAAMTGTLRAALDEQGDAIGPLARIGVGVEGIVDGDGKVFLSSPVVDVRDIPVAACSKRNSARRSNWPTSAT